LIRWNEGNKGIRLPSREANCGNQTEGNQYENGDERTHRSHIPDAPDIDVGEEDDDGGLEQILL